jgi:phenylalanyl-tRNA synthetase alpha chain
MTTQQVDLEAQLAQLRHSAQAAIATADTLEQLEQLRINYLGKKGELSQVLRGMGRLNATDRPRIGALANKVKEVLQGDLDRKRLGELRQQIQTNLYNTLPGELMSGTAFEADELYQNAGEKKYAASRRGRPAAPARQ